jgi:hypothetical protein
VSIQLVGQDTVYTSLPAFGGKTFKYLKSSGAIIDAAPNSYEYNKSLIYFALKTDKGQIEFFKENDMTFYAREKIQETYANLGYYRIDKRNPIDTHYTYLLNPETFAKTLEISYIYDLKKQGTWKENLGTDTSRTRNYNYGLKHGGCIINIYGKNVSAVYDNGKIIGFYKPFKRITQNHLIWLINTGIYLKNHMGNNYDERSNLSSDTLMTNIEYTGRFIFYSDNTFDFNLSTPQQKLKKEQENRLKELQDRIDVGEFAIEKSRYFLPEKKGKWSLGTDNEIWVTFSDNTKKVFYIQYFSKELITMSNRQ